METRTSTFASRSRVRFITDDWKVRPSITLTLGVRWEYESPIMEKYGRLVNLDIPPGFASATPVVASPSDSLIRTDKTESSRAWVWHGALERRHR